ncbi:MAG: hypothetical protein FE042_01220 [Thermoplasmata archaeon]|nr:MAG: hypothetical protein FE042_01220 [Thermoplasmata archaeon]
MRIDWKKMLLSIAVLTIVMASFDVIAEEGSSPPKVMKIDDDDPEFTIEDIVSPPSKGGTGTYPIIVNFTANTITTDGLIEGEEQWVDCEDSPDSTGDFSVNFYTACDPNYVYVAFSNDTGILYQSTIYIYIDENGNGTWDGADEGDDCFVVNFGDSMVMDHFGNYIEGSSVGWNIDDSKCYSVEIGIPRVNWTGYPDWAFDVNVSCSARNPSWGDASAPPCPTSFLAFPYNYTQYPSPCPCCLCLKALVDIYKVIPGNITTIYQTDFEENDTVDWIAYSLDDNSDTWTLSENRSHSSSHSYHCTGHSEYMGNAHDVLEMRNPLDLSGVNNVTLTFWSWCEGDSYYVNGSLIIADYGDVEISNDGGAHWISLSDLGLSQLYYDNDWMETKITIESSQNYSGIPGEELLTGQVKFRFVWYSSPQFQYEGWYIDDIRIDIGEKPSLDLVWEGNGVPCIPFGSTITYSFPLNWTVKEGGKYRMQMVCQEEPNYKGVRGICREIIIGDYHDLAVISLDVPSTVERGEDVPIDATIKNLGTYDESDVQVKVTVENENGATVWSRTVVIPSLNISEEKRLHFVWENTTYCNYNVTVSVISPDDAVPENNAMYGFVIVAHEIFYDDMECGPCTERNWKHLDLTGREGHWIICTSGYDHYLWCGLDNATTYDNNWNDFAMIEDSFDTSAFGKVTLSFKTWYRILPGDYGYVEVSTDNGTCWQIVATYTGQLNWTNVTLNISAYKSTGMKIRFRFVSNETGVERGWIIDDVSLMGDSITLFEDDFESGTDGWIIEYAGDWWHITTRRYHSESHSWWCGDELSGRYMPNLNNALMMRETIDLSKSFGADIIFWTWYNFSSGDEGYLEVSEDGGATWTIVKSFTGMSSTDSTPGWTKVLCVLDSWAGKNIKIRFRFSSDSTAESEGWYIDDVRVLAKIDKEPPVTTHSLSGTMGLNDWYISPVTITLTADDGDGSGVEHIYYCLDGCGIEVYTSPITVSTGGPHTLEYWSVDKVGNQEAHHTITFKIDTVNPTVEISQPTPGIYVKGRKIWPIFGIFKCPFTLIIGSIDVKVNANDENSGVDRVEFYIDEDLLNTDTEEPYEWTWNERVFFTHTITVKVYDKAGLTAEDSIEVKIFNLALGAGPSYGRLKGKVYENGTFLKKGIGGAVVTVMDIGMNTTTGDKLWNKGWYSIQLRPGTYDIKIEAPGYQTKIVEGVVIKAGRTTRLDVGLDKTS